MGPDNAASERILVLAPRGRDAQVIEQVMIRSGLHCLVCADFSSLMQSLRMAAGAALITEEALYDADLSQLVNWLSRQPSWSDFPFVVLVSQHPGKAGPAISALQGLGNIMLLERPINAETLRSAVSSALRARRRQYQARSDLQERATSEERLRIALQAGKLGAWEIIYASRTLYASPACKANFGLASSSPFEYEHLLAAIHPEDHAQRRAIETAIASHVDLDVELRAQWPDGALHWLHLQAKASYDDSGQPAKLIGVAQDVTERRESDRRLRESQEALLNLNATLESRIQERTAALAQANDMLMREMTERERAQMALVQTQKMEALGHLTSGISHDFNNLLSVIQGNADLIHLLSAEDRIRRMANTIRKAAEQGAKLTGQLLAFSRGQRLDLKAIDLNKALGEIKDLLKASLGSNIQLRFELAPEIPYVKADLNQVELAVLNLVINAKDALHSGGSVTIQTSVRQACDDLAAGCEYAVISVIDDGEGINPEILDKVFDPFFTTKPLGKGTGLGLSQVYGIAQQSGGAAKIKSEVGIGTTVEIWLPFAQEEAVGDTLPRGDEGAGFETRRSCVLVVEDDPRVRQFIVECLEILGYQVEHADQGQVAVNKLETMQPDLLITDFLMPGMTGAELIRRAKQKFPQMPAIIATGYADLQAVDEVIEADMVLQKPFQLNDLAYKVQYALNRARSALPQPPIEQAETSNRQ